MAEIVGLLSDEFLAGCVDEVATEVDSLVDQRVAKLVQGELR